MSSIVIILSVILGTLIGIFTGIIPGMHPNNTSLILVSFCLPFSSTDIGIILVFILISMCISQTFVNFIPNTFFGAPEKNTKSMLPAHRMLLKGKGYHAVFLSAIGSLVALCIGILIVIPCWLLITSFGIHTIIDNYLLYILLTISIIIIITEHRKIPYRKAVSVYAIQENKMIYENKDIPHNDNEIVTLQGKIKKINSDYFLTEKKNRTYLVSNIPLGHFVDKNVIIYGKTVRTHGKYSHFAGICIALSVFILTGVFGIMVFQINVTSPVIHINTSPLFPVFSGLFGISTLVFSYKKITKIPKQRISIPRINLKKSVSSILRGTISGAFVGFIPAITSGIGTVLGCIRRKNITPEQTVLTMSAVNTTYTLICIVILFTIMKPRNGVMIAVNYLFQSVFYGDTIPNIFVLILISTILSGIIACFITIHLGRYFATKISSMHYRAICLILITICFILVGVFTGFIGLILLMVSTIIGLVPLHFSVRRTHTIGVILLPVIILCG